MKYELDTIPLWDALKAGTECPFCLLERRSRNAALRYYLGPSVMVPEVRQEVNAVGFSPDHTRLLAKDPNKLGLALITHTRLKKIREDLEKLTGPLVKEAEKAGQKNALEALVSSKSALVKGLEKLGEQLRQEELQCLIEAKIQEDLNRFYFTLVHLWKKDPDFQEQWKSGKGICLHHTPGLLDMAGQELDSRTLGQFAAVFLPLLMKNLERVENDVLSFTQTFDATQSHTITGQVEGALDRALLKLVGAFKEYEDEGKSRKGPLMGM